MKRIVVLYHYDCPDGFGAAWAAWRKFGASADYFAVKHQEPPPSGLKNKEIYMIDFTYFGRDLQKLIKENFVTTLDHHIGAKKEILTAPRHLYALNHSGAVLAWKFFHPSQSVPWLLRFIEDRDLWKFKLPKSNAILTVVDLSKYDFHKWNKLADDLENPTKRKQYAIQGTAMLKYENAKIEKIIEKADRALFQGRQALVVNSPILKSAVGNALLKRGVSLAIVWRREGNKIYVSLRSTDKIDVSKLAQRYGGGGHKRAAGFTYPAGVKLPWRYLE